MTFAQLRNRLASFINPHSFVRGSELIRAIMVSKGSGTRETESFQVGTDKELEIVQQTHLISANMATVSNVTFVDLFSGTLGTMLDRMQGKSVITIIVTLINVSATADKKGILRLEIGLAAPLELEIAGTGTDAIAGKFEIHIFLPPDGDIIEVIGTTFVTQGAITSNFWIRDSLTLDPEAEVFVKYASTTTAAAAGGVTTLISSANIYTPLPQES